MNINSFMCVVEGKDLPAHLGMACFHISHVLLVVWAPVKGDVHGYLVHMGNI